MSFRLALIAQQQHDDMRIVASAVFPHRTVTSQCAIRTHASDCLAVAQLLINKGNGMKKAFVADIHGHTASLWAP